VRPTERGETVIRGNRLSNQVNVEVTPEGERGVLITGNEFDEREAAQVALEPLNLERLGPEELFGGDWRRGSRSTTVRTTTPSRRPTTSRFRTGGRSGRSRTAAARASGWPASSSATRRTRWGGPTAS
jgi:hypothetical protein